VRHQLLYEVHDPAAYFAPDVVADFTSAAFTDLGSDRMRVEGVRGAPATPTYKALLAYHAGWSGEARAAFSWPDAYEKAKATAALLAKRVEMAGLAVDEWCFEFWGANALGGPTAPPPHEPPEVAIRAGDKGDIADVAIFADDEETYDLIAREVTAERVKQHFGAMVRGAVDRYEARNVLALNFVLRDALGGGGPRSLRSDSLGKTLGG